MKKSREQLTGFLRYWWCVLSRTCEYRGIHPDRCDGVVKWEAGRSAYVTKIPKGRWDNPNRDMLLCGGHAQEHHVYWNDMWDQVPRG